MSTIGKLNNRICSVTLFLILISYSATGNHYCIPESGNIAWIASEKPFYKSGNCCYRVAIASGKNYFTEHFHSLNSNVFIARVTDLSLTKIRVQGRILFNIKEPLHVRIPMLLYHDENEAIHHYFAG